MVRTTPGIPWKIPGNLSDFLSGPRKTPGGTVVSYAPGVLRIIMYCKKQPTIVEASNFQLFLM